MCGKCIKLFGKWPKIAHNDTKWQRVGQGGPTRSEYPIRVPWQTLTGTDTQTGRLMRCRPPGQGSHQQALRRGPGEAGGTALVASPEAEHRVPHLCSPDVVEGRHLHRGAGDGVQPERLRPGAPRAGGRFETETLQKGVRWGISLRPRGGDSLHSLNPSGVLGR